MSCCAQDIVRRLAESERDTLPISHSTSSFPRQKYAWPAASQSAPIKPSLKRHGFAMPAPAMPAPATAAPPTTAATRATPASRRPKAEVQRPEAGEEPRVDGLQRREQRPAATPAQSAEPTASTGAVLPPRLQPLGSGAFSRPAAQLAAPEQERRPGRPGDEEPALPSPANPAPGVPSNATAGTLAEGAKTANAPGATVDHEESWRKSELVRAKILETMKRGISQAKNRTDLGAGELQLLEHMKMCAWSCAITVCTSFAQCPSYSVCARPLRRLLFHFSPCC
eukprot:6181089-Pleurochrysis_carterae.AAC.2